jgi:hypothetical protein
LAGVLAEKREAAQGPEGGSADCARGGKNHGAAAQLLNPGYFMIV